MWITYYFLLVKLCITQGPIRSRIHPVDKWSIYPQAYPSLIILRSQDLILANS